MMLPRSTLLVGILGVGPLCRATESQRAVKIEKVEEFAHAANPSAGPAGAGRATMPSPPP
jgi:hypothetical protein